MDIAKLNVKLTASAGAFASTMNGAARQVTSLGKSIHAVGSKVFSFGGALVALAAGGSMVALVKNSLDSIDALKDQADALGVTTEALSRLNYAASFAGVGSEEMGSSLQKMLRNIDDARAGSGTAGDAFRALGLDAAKLAAMSPDEALREIAGAMEAVENPAQRVGLAMDLFGKSGASMLPVLANGKAGLAELAAEADKLGVTIKSADAAKIEAANDAMDRMKAGITGAANTLAIELAPFIELAANKLTELGTSGEGVGSKVVTAVEWVATGIAAAADVLELFRAGWHVLRGVAATAIAGVMAPLTLLIQGVEWLGNKLAGTTSNFREQFELMQEAIAEEAKEAFRKAGESWDTFEQGLNSQKVAEQFASIRKAADDAANAVKKVPPKPPLDIAAMKQQAQNLAKVADTLADLQKDLTTFGMSDSDKKLFDLEALGATPEQMAKAKQLLSLRDELTKLQGVSTGDPLADFATKMERLQALYAQGRVTAEQFQRIRATAMTSLNEKLADDAKSITDSVKTPLEQYAAELDKLNALMERGLISQETFDRAKLKAKSALESAQGTEAVAPQIVRAGSAEALRLAFDQTRGVQRLTKDEVSKKQLAEAQEHTRTLERIERNTRGGTTGDLQTVEI